MTTKEHVVKYVIDMCCEMLIRNKDEVSMDSDLANDLGADDLDFVELVMDSEMEFGICIKEAEAAGIHTVGDLVRLVCEKLGLE